MIPNIFHVGRLIGTARTNQLVARLNRHVVGAANSSGGSVGSGFGFVHDGLLQKHVHPFRVEALAARQFEQR